MTGTAWPELLFREGEPRAVSNHPSLRRREGAASRAADIMRGQTVRLASTGNEPAVGRRFQLQRDEDISGVSGLGVVADGCVFPDGAAVVHWRGEHRSTVVWTEGISAVEAVHGHEGRTRIVWVD